MSVANWTPADTVKAKAIWADYQLQHDVSARNGQTVGIDPKSEQVWFGESIADVVSQRDACGVDRPLFFERVGAPAYWRKGLNSVQLVVSPMEGCIR